MKRRIRTIGFVLVATLALGVGELRAQAEDAAENADTSVATGLADATGLDAAAVVDLGSVEDAPSLDRGAGISTIASVGHSAPPDTATFVFVAPASLGNAEPAPLNDAEQAAINAAVAPLDYGATVRFAANPVSARVTVPAVDLSARVVALRDAMIGAVPRLSLQVADLAIADCEGVRAEAAGRAADAATAHAVALAAAVGSRAEGLTSVDISVDQRFGDNCVVGRRASPSSLASAALEFVGSATAVHELAGVGAPRLRTYATGSGSAPIGWARMELSSVENDAGEALRARLTAAGMPASAFQSGGPSLYLRVPTATLDPILGAVEPIIATGARIDSLHWEAADCAAATVDAEVIATRWARLRISRFAQQQQLVLGSLRYLATSSLPYDDLRGEGNCTVAGSSLSNRPLYMVVTASVTAGYAVL